MTSSETYAVPDERMLDTSDLGCRLPRPRASRGPLPTEPASWSSVAASWAHRRLPTRRAGRARRSAPGAPPGRVGQLLARGRAPGQGPRHRTPSPSWRPTASRPTRPRGTHGLPVAFNENGSLTLARQPGRVDELLDRPAWPTTRGRGHHADARRAPWRPPADLAGWRAGCSPPTGGRHGQPRLVGRRDVKWATSPASSCAKASGSSAARRGPPTCRASPVSSPTRVRSRPSASCCAADSGPGTSRVRWGPSCPSTPPSTST